MAIRVFVFATLLASTVLAQTTKPADPYQQAYQRMLERQAARAAASTKPANITNAELDALKKKIVDLEHQVADLLNQNAALRLSIEKLRDATPKPGQDAKASWSAKVKRGMTFQEVRDAIGFEPRHIMTNADGEKVVAWMVGPAGAPTRTITVTFKDDRVVDFTEEQ